MMKCTKRIYLNPNNAKVANNEPELKPANETNMISDSFVKCFVCDRVIIGEGISLMLSCVPHSKTGFPKKIGELMGDGFMIIINEDDFLCRKCTNLLNYVDKLEAELEISKKALTVCLKTKYNLLNSEETDITVSDIKNPAVQEKVTKSGEFDVSVFLQSTDDSKQSGCSKGSVHEPEIEILTENEKRKTGYSNWQDGTNKKFNCSECNKCFESQLEAEEHLQSHLTTTESSKQSCYRCHLCTFQTADMTFLKRHVQIHLTKPVYQCSLCPKRFKSKPHLVKHMSIHCVFKCGFCSEKFNESAKLLRHLQVHKRKELKSKQEAPVVSVDIASEDHHHQLQSIANSADFEKKEDNLKSFETETLSNVEDSNLQKDPLSLQGLRVDCKKIEELMAKLNADDDLCSNNEGNSTSENNELEDSNTTDCQKPIDDEFSGANNEINDSTDVLVKEVNAMQDRDSTDIVEHVSNESSNYSEWEHLKTHQESGNGMEESDVRMYECYICTRKFTSQANLTRHLGKHGASFEKIHCKLCSEEIIDEMHLGEHISKVHTTSLRCFYCSQEFTNQKELEQHELAHPENSTHRCNLCKKRFVTETRLRAHVKTAHTDAPGDKIYKCNICSKSLTTFYNLKRHLVNHKKSEKNAQCDICFEMLTDKLHLRQHVEDVHPSVYQCGFCQQTFSNRKVCRAHEATHPERYVYKCDNCPSSFTDKIILAKHNSVFHRDPHCKYCGKEITVPSKLSTHERRHELYKDKFPCKYCSKVFQTPSGLKYHMSKHTGEYAVYCEICGRGLHSEILLEEHMASHTKEARYTCDVCGRNFSARSTYRLHRKWHDDPLPYRCKFCNRRFKHTSVMAVHIRRTHTGERPYKCPHCPQTFSVSSTLHKHVILHTKNYPFTCKYCSKGFTVRGKVAWHMAKAHHDYDMVNSKPPPCEYKMALKPSEMPSVSVEDDPPESSQNDVSGETFQQTVIEQTIEGGQTMFWFQEGFV